MQGFSLSKKAAQDLKGAYRHTFRQFGENQAEKYTQGLIRCFAMLADSPRLGLDIGDLRQGYFRFRHESHTIFYKITASDIWIMRILHNRMDPDRHL